jgi:hypothetical protein
VHVDLIKRQLSLSHISTEWLDRPENKPLWRSLHSSTSY